MEETNGNKKYERRQKCRNKWNGRKIEEGGKRLLVPVLEFR